MLRVALMALLAMAVLAPVVRASESSESGAERSARRETRLAEQSARRLAHEAERSAARQAREAERETRRTTHEAFKLAHLQDGAGDKVTFSCTGVSIAYTGFPEVPGSANTVVESVSIRNGTPWETSHEGVTLPPVTSQFTGSSATVTLPIAFPVGEHYLVDVHAKWNTNGYAGNFDIHSQLTCGPAPAFTVEKLQTIQGSTQPFTQETLSGDVGQTVDYEIRVTNTGNTPLTFGRLSDPYCDSATIVGDDLLPVEPMGTYTYTCSHVLTGFDQTRGYYTNVANVTGTPEEGEGLPAKHESNPVTVSPVDPESKEGKGGGGTGSGTGEESTGGTSPSHEEKTPGSGGTSTDSSTGVTNGTGAPSGSGSTSSTSSSKSGVLGFISATVPSLHGPLGCVRDSFVVSVKSAGVSSVTFYLDGHRLKSLSAKAARKGLLSIRIDIAKLRIGAHRIVAKITMKPTSSTAKAQKASRGLVVVHCASAAVKPRFTG
jgi:hypothetical protein